MNKERKSINKIKLMIKKNKHVMKRLVVSEEFMLQLQEHADLLEITEKKMKATQDYSAHGKDHLTEETMEITFLWGVQVYLSDHIIHGAVMEMLNGEFFVLKNI